jgi:ATP-dependent helicase/nuclease subunit B
MARQWECMYASEATNADSTAWPTPAIMGIDAWLDSLYDEARGADSARLGRRQCIALWRRIVEESSDGKDLIDHGAVARWGFAAWELFCKHLIDPLADSGLDDSHELSAFLRWRRRYVEELAAHGWTDSAMSLGVLDWLDELPTRNIRLCDLRDLTPAHERLIRTLKDRDWRVVEDPAPARGATAVRVAADSVSQELQAALAWSIDRLRRRPDRRIALSVQDLDAQRSALERGLSDYRDIPVGWSRNRRLTTQPAVAAALDGIELLTPEAGFRLLSRWLLSSYFQGPEAAELAAAARCEAESRGTLWPQLTLRAAFEHGGVREHLRSRAPAAALRLEQALEWAMAGSRERTPTAWATTWRTGLEVLGWGSGASRVSEAQAVAWEELLRSYSALTPVLGGVNAGTAIAELRRLAQETALPSKWPVRGLYVFEHIDDIGPGYDAAWCTGFSQDNWPRPVLGNPLLPRRLQQRHRLPWSSPADSLRRHTESTAGLMARVPNIVFSWSAQGSEPGSSSSPLLDGLETQSPSATASSAGETPAIGDARALEHIEDTILPLREQAVPGGIPALNLQARCPLRAFIEHRLRAKALDPPVRGVPPALRGVMLHRAAELLLPAGTTSGRLVALLPAASERRIKAAAEKAVREGFGPSLDLLPTLARLETERIERVLGRLLEAELARLPFTILEVESRRDIRVGLYRLSGRLDRLDRLENGDLLILDYKTGRNARTSGWYSERLADTQVPVYSTEFGAELSGAALCDLSGRGIVYRGYWPSEACFPSPSGKLPKRRSWVQQLDVWSEQIATLADELMSGDSRVFVADWDYAAGSFAPLTRVYERRALQSK